MTRAGTGLSAVEVIEALGLQPHPEGGHFAETFRDPATDRAGRSASTAIYYLLREGQRSAWHRVTDAAETWHWYAGSPLELNIAPPDGAPVSARLGNDIRAGERPQAVVPPGHWQSAASCGEWTLVGCTVAPGFEFASFELAPDDWEPGPPGTQ